MKMKSESNRNLSFMYRGGSILIPAGATLDLTDELYKKIKDTMAETIENGVIVITEPCEKTEEELAEEKAAALEAARDLLDKESDTEVSTKDATEVSTKDATEVSTKDATEVSTKVPSKVNKKGK